MQKDDTADPIMPFGQYKGLRVSEIPTDYLKWLLSSVLYGGPIHDAVRRELEERMVQ